MVSYKSELGAHPLPTDEEGDYVAIPAFTKTLVETKLGLYCENRVSPGVKDKLRLGFEFKGDSVTLFEERPYFRDPAIWTKSDIAKFKYTAKNQEWTLYCRDRNSGSVSV